LNAPKRVADKIKDYTQIKKSKTVAIPPIPSLQYPQSYGQNTHIQATSCGQKVWEREGVRERERERLSVAQ